MSLITVCQALAKNVGLEIPTVILLSSQREHKEMVELSQLAVEELARRVDWGQLTKSATLTGDGTNLTFSLPTGFSRLTRGITITSPKPVRSLTRAEWGSLVAVEGVPRYFLLEDDKVTLWPYLATSETVDATYQTKNWCSSGGLFWTFDSDTSLIDEDLLLKGLIVRWRRQKGMEYADYEAEYEAAVAQFAQFNDRGRF